MGNPVVKLAAKVGILTSLLSSRLEGIEPGEAAELTAPLGELDAPLILKPRACATRSANTHGW